MRLHLYTPLVFIVSLFWQDTTALAQGTLATVRTVDGQKVVGTLRSWNGRQLTLMPQEADKPLQLSSDELFEVLWEHDKQPFDVATSFVELVDGSRLPLETCLIEDRVAEISTQWMDEPITFSTDIIHSIQLDPSSEVAKQVAQELDANKLDGDVLVIKKKKASGLEFLSGILGDVSSDRINFEWDGEEIPVNRTKVAALAFYHPKKQKPGKTRCVLTTTFGASFAIASLEWQSEQIKVQTVSGLELVLEQSVLQRADYSLGKLAYLSDLSPEKEKWTPLISLPNTASLLSAFGQPRKNQSFSGSALTLAWPDEQSPMIDIRTYEKGLALQSRTELQYRIPEGMNRFSCLAGIAPKTASEGHVVLQIFTDKQLAWEGEIEGSAAPVSIDLEISGAKRLRIFVDYGENLDFGDRLHLVEARMSK